MPELFTLFHEAFAQLAQTSQPAVVLRLCELRVLMAIGYTPQLLHCARCARALQPHERTFSPHLGGLVCQACTPAVRHTFAISATTLDALRQAMESDTADMPFLDTDAAGYQELERILHTHLTACLGRELKSYAFLQL